MITYRDIADITFPVFTLPSYNWELKDGLFFVDGLVVDDRNMPGKTLGLRRAQTNKELLRIGRASWNLVALLKQYKKYFIDSTGYAFVYKKTRYMQVKYYRIIRVELKEEHSLLWLKGINFPFVIPRPPLYGLFYAGVLHKGDHPWLLWDYSEGYKKQYRKKV